MKKPMEVMTHRQMLAFVLFLLPGFVSQAQLNYSQQKKVVCENAAVVSAHPLASQSGIDIIKQGGNAFDAAIATQLALAVVYPGAGNLGGGAMMVAHLKDGNNIALDYREKAPFAAKRDMYLDDNGNPIPGLSQVGHLACGVPGSVAGIFKMLQYARFNISRLIAPAIKLAKEGFMLTATQAKSLNDNRQSILKANWHPTAFVKDSLWKEGDVLIQPELAATLERISKKGMREFYRGKTAKLLVKEMAKGKGIITIQDLRNYQPVERKVTDFMYKGHRVISMPLPSSGGTILQQLMMMAESRDIGKLGFQTAESVQLMVEMERRAYADRTEYLGDIDFVNVPLNTLLSDTYLRQRMSDFIPGKAGNSITTKAGNIPESEETTHISIMDNEGNAVAVTTTLNDSYGCKVVVEGGGFFLNNEMDDFSIKEGYPNLYGAVGTKANAIAPRKRMLSSMTPTIVLKDNKPFIIVGSPGGTTISTTVFQTLMNILEFGLSPEEAVNKPKFHHQWLPDVIYVEKDFPLTVSRQLEQMGYTIKPRDPIGRTELIVIKYAPSRQLIAVADRRADDDARCR